MIDIAVTYKLRNDPKVRRLRKQLESGDASVKDALYRELLRDITDDDIRQSLQICHMTNKPEAPEKLVQQLQDVVLQRKKSDLFPKEGDVRLGGTVALRWKQLALEIERTAERLWRDNLLEDASLPDAKRRLADLAQKRHLAELANKARSLMQLAVEVWLYRLRSLQNFQRENVRLALSRRFSMQNDVRKIIRRNRRVIRHWDHTLRSVNVAPVFLEQIGAGRQLNKLAKEFSPDNITPSDESGWITRANDAVNELRYQYFDARLGEMWRTHNVFAALWNFARKITTGFGIKPGRFVGTAFICVGAYAIIFFLNDYYNHGVFATDHYCSASNSGQLAIPDLIIKYAYLAVTNLASLGSNAELASYCGGNATRLILISSALVGYFLLATLAALVFEPLREAEQ